MAERRTRGDDTIGREVLIVVDMQNDFLEQGAPMRVPGAEEAVRGVADALGVARESGLSVVYTRAAYHPLGWDRGGSAAFFAPVGEGRCLVEGSHGAEIYEELRPRKEDVVVRKHRYSGFHGTDLEIVLRGMDARQLVICGVTTENCCFSTARDAMFRGFDVVMLADATAAYGYTSHTGEWLDATVVRKTVLAVVAGSTGRVVSVEQWRAALDV